MSTQTADVEMINFEVDGVLREARKGDMIIHVTDQTGTHVPRFCYHKKLPIAANCRMCLVDVEGAPKPMPACATPVTEGMKVFTRSERALNAQKAVLEFQLINHPLDCPICDQGGECELQDVAIGYGNSQSAFGEDKLVAEDPDLGSLIATDMTRCILCTRCVRTLEVVAGQKELGATGRGETTRIGTYIERAVTSELSGNVIDVCPVGALTSKPFRYKARSWELQQRASVAPHDALGSNIALHTRGREVLRVVPSENESVNEVWISDRDRYSYEGLYADDRLLKPQLRSRGGELGETDWDTALAATVDGLKAVIDEHGSDAVGFLVSPYATLEEQTLAASLAAGLGCNNIDSRLRQQDFRAQDVEGAHPWLGRKLTEIDTLDSVLLVGTDIRKEMPVLSHRIRKAACAGASVSQIAPIAFDLAMPTEHSLVSAAMVDDLAGVLAAAKNVDGGEEAASDEQAAIANALKDAGNASILLGAMALASADYAVLRNLCIELAEATGATFGLLPQAGNAAGAALAGAIPHRGPAAESSKQVGLDAQAMLNSGTIKAWCLVGVEPELDMADAAAARRGIVDNKSAWVVSLSSFLSDTAKSYVAVALPVAPFAETSGTFVNLEGRWQSFDAATRPHGDSRPGWKVLRVLGNQFDLPGFDYLSSEEIRDALASRCNGIEISNGSVVEDLNTSGASDKPRLLRIGDAHIYATDSLVRRSLPLQNTPDASVASLAVLGTDEAMKRGLKAGDRVKVTQGDSSVELDVACDAAVADGAVRICSGLQATSYLGMSFGPVDITPVTVSHDSIGDAS